MKKKENENVSKLKIIPLGGLEQIGMNITAFEYEDSIIVVDCGLSFPDDDMLGIDLVIPDVTYLKENADKVKGFMITHGHEDHIGALPYVLREINVPIYATKLTMGIIENKLKEHNLTGTTKRKVVKFGQSINLGKFRIEFIKTNHSIVDAAALAIYSPAGIVVHTGDFKVDYTPVFGDAIDLQRFAEIGKKGVLALMCDSTNAERPGFTPSERTVGRTFDMLFEEHKNTRIIIGFPGWCLQTKDVVGRYEAYKNILFPIADTGHPQYMEPDIFPPAEKEIYVDVGVYDLQNSIDFSKWAVKGYEKIYAFEPDPQCFQHSLERLNEMGDEFQRKMELVQKGLSDVNGILEFPSEYKGSGIYGEGGTISVEVVSLDSYLNGRPVTLVKMDVEGAEMNVLLGMRETILRYKPRLEICVYHKHEDLFEIASFLLDLVPEYKFYLRHYNSNETETVLFCMV